LRCIFCKTESSASRSVEHIIPESLGNTKAVLPPGVVCDSCNNYFARKIEKPLLDTPYFRNLRGRQRIDSKRGRVPAQDALLLTQSGLTEGIKAKLFLPSVRHINRHGVVHIEDMDDVKKVFARRGEVQLLVGASEDDIGGPKLLSRFLAKVALELLVDRLSKTDNWQSFIIDNSELDPVRLHARRGTPASWEYSRRRIYHENDRIMMNNEDVQTVWEWDALAIRVTDASMELYSVLALFGQEYVINFGGPSMDGYRAWLDASNHASPLHPGGLPNQQDVDSGEKRPDT
jgi:hypothetical protein